jgi:hypothetical protein
LCVCVFDGIRGGQACLPEHEDRKNQLSKAVGADQIILGCILGLSIVSPDMLELRRIIMDTHYTTTASETLRWFKDRCISSCLITAGKRNVNWTTVMRLYLAAYCRQEIRKELWTYVLQNESHQGYFRASPETDSMVHAYVKAHPMSLGEAVDVMLESI